MSNIGMLSPMTSRIVPSLPPPLLLADVFMHTTFNDDFKRQQNSALLLDHGLVKAASENQ